MSIERRAHLNKMQLIMCNLIIGRALRTTEHYGESCSENNIAEMHIEHPRDTVSVDCDPEYKQSLVPSAAHGSHSNTTSGNMDQDDTHC